MHGGASPQARAAAQRRKAEAQATALLELIWDANAAPVTDPVGALQAIGGKTLHAIDVLGARVSTEELDGPTAVAWLRVLREGRQLLEGLQRLGLEERQVRVSEAQGQMLAAVVRSVLDRMLAATLETVGRAEAEELGLAESWVSSARVIVPEELRRLSERDGSVVRGEVG